MNVPVTASSQSFPQEPLTLGQAQGLALELSPELASFAWEVRAREGRALQAGLRPNPELGGEIEDFGGTGELGGGRSAESTLGFSQLIETGGKRSKRRKAADIDIDVARWDYEAARLRVLANVEVAFSRVLAAQQRVVLSQELLELAEASGGAVGRLVQAGATPTVERTRASVESGIARVELSSARRTLAAARAQLAATWGADSASFERALGDLGAVQPLPPLETLQEGLRRNPALMRWDRELARRESVVELEDAQSMPNLVARAGLRRVGDVDENAFQAGFSVPLPLFDRNQGSRAAARSDVRRATYERRATEVDLRAQLSEAYQELVARSEEVSELRTTILPGAEEAFQGVRRGLAQGLFRNVDVLDAQRRLFELRIRELDALRAYHAAQAEVDRLTGSTGDVTAAPRRNSQ